MRARPAIVSAALILLALVHARWGIRMLFDSALLLATSQIVSAGGLLLAGAGARSRGTLATGLAIASGATLLRILATFGSPSPFLPFTGVLTVGMALAAWGAVLADRPTPPGATALALRGGLALMGVAYAGFLALNFALGGAVLDKIDVATRLLAALAAATFVEAPPLALARARAEGGGDPAGGP